MAKPEIWPNSLTRFVGPDGVLLLRPQGLIPGQLPVFVIFGIAALAALGGIFALPAQRLASVAFLCACLVVLAIPLRQLARWTRIARTDSGWRIQYGIWRWESSSIEVAAAEIQAALVVKDDKGYRLEFPVYEHVRLAFVAKPFNEPAAALEIAELFRLDRPALDGLAATLAPGASVT